MVHTIVNRELASLGADLTSTHVSKGYVTCCKSEINSAIHGAEENNVLPLQTITSDGNEEALAGVAVALGLLSPSTDNPASEIPSQSSVNMKCYYHQKTSPLLRQLE